METPQACWRRFPRLVTQLLGEYVPEIIVDICRDVSDSKLSRMALYRRLLAENP